MHAAAVDPHCARMQTPGGVSACVGTVCSRTMMMVMMFADCGFVLLLANACVCTNERIGGWMDTRTAALAASLVPEPRGRGTRDVGYIRRE